MAFGDTIQGTGPTVKICCGPRCGAEPGHRLIYAAVESVVTVTVRPMLCQGLCGQGVTVTLPNGTSRKIRDTAEARALKIEH
jgi:NADH:ubiquinone oxidoreductase subunit E